MGRQLASKHPAKSKGGDEHAEYLRRRLKPLNRIFSEAAIGNFHLDLKMPKTEDEFTELFAGVQIMIDVVREKIAEAEAANTTLEQRIAGRTAELQESEARLRSIMENAPSFIELLDRDLNVTFINQTVPGTPREKVTGRSFADFLEPAAAQRITPLLREVLRTGNSVAYETEASGGNGARAWYHTTAGPIREGRAIIGVALIATDITATKRVLLDLEKRSRELEAFNQLMIGRELKMIELKRENELLRQRAKEHSG